MGTHDEVRKLRDGDFHRLGDDLLRRVEPRCRRLRTHGLNERGESIKGQPDSYVGNTAKSCVVAVCYTVQRSSWWNKVVEDVRKVIAVCPSVEEVFVVIPHDADRDGPDGPKVRRPDWLSDAKAAAGAATLKVYDGREISTLLDTEHQDLRYEHLGIPYSRLTVPSIQASCRSASQRIIDLIVSSGRYDPDRYIPRDADRELSRIWQAARRHLEDPGQETGRVRLIALVSDSGVGKSSLVCEFARRFGTMLPVLLLQARDLLLNAEDGLVASVLQSIQGALDPSVRATEEAALCKHLAGNAPLTVILDGLDEAHAPESVRKAVSHWLRSRLGESSILIVTSRREFWRTCADPSWQRWMPKPASDDRSSKNAEPGPTDRGDPISGIRLPDRFLPDELESAWLRAREERQDLYSLPAQVQDELRHPFTLRVFLELRRQNVTIPSIPTRAALLECWLNRRLDAESLPTERITRDHFQRALRTLASRAADTNAGSLCVDDLSGLPRFDPAHPPGPVLQRLIEANLLETVPGRSDHIRFAVEAVQDFYRADADIEEIRHSPSRMAEEYSRLSFTTAYTRLERVGHRLADESVRDEFARRLAEWDVRLAAVVVRPAIDSYSPDTRRYVAEQLGLQILARHRVRAAMAITLLGELRCVEALEVLEEYLLSSAEVHPFLKSEGASAFTRLGHAPAAPFVYRWGRFGVSSGVYTYYYKELLGTIRGSRPEFRRALADEAIRQISSLSGSPEHAKAAGVLAYLGDPRLVDFLEDRFSQNGLLQHYESHALIAVGTDRAGDLFARSVLAVGERLSGIPDDYVNSAARHRIIDMVLYPSYDIRYLIKAAFEPHLQRLIESDNWEVSWIAGDLAKRGLVARLLYADAIASERRDVHQPERDELRACIETDLWLEWWRRATDLPLKRRLLGMLPLHPSGEVEAILLECLDLPELCASAARELGNYGIVSSARHLRRVLTEAATPDKHWAKAAAARSLGDLRDGHAVKYLEATAGQLDDDWAVSQAVWSLGLIGGTEAEAALERLLRLEKGDEFEDRVMEAMLHCGTKSAVATVIDRARSKNDAARWLFTRLDRMSLARGWRRGEFYTHIYCDELVDYLASEFPTDTPGWDPDVRDAFRVIDGPAVRRLLREWARRFGTDRSPHNAGNGTGKISNIYFEALRDRGDESALDDTLDEREHDGDVFYVEMTARHLLNFERAEVRRRLHDRLEASRDATKSVRLLALLGRFGEQPDIALASRFLDDPDDLVANVACETMLRLSDPLLVPDRWREL
ncbi:MAG: HEAT repeat domain-containing protein [Isosphaeraceae bacterium]|nr:HEAT repeat domain-containing protein [Isosphaeraceae bacterium]